jgi:16S rRNA (uracil1498-N3)-methyltransferase
MRDTRIFTTTALHSGAAFLLEPEPSRHIAKALRMHVGDTLTLFDGRGGEYPATITVIGKKQVEVKTGERLDTERESPLRVHLGIAVSRGDRSDWVIQKATELGVARITPLVTGRTGVKLSGERAEKKLAHWRQIAVSACEQCGRNRVPVVDPLQPCDDFIGGSDAQLKLVLHHRAQTLLGRGDAIHSALLLVGPEGGLSDDEIARAEQAGFSPLALGPRVMRTETAPLAALAILQGRWGDMRPG